jgi:hypothetical protein
MSVVAAKPRGVAAAHSLAVDFSQAGASRPLLREGFSAQEPEFVWSIGPRSRILLPDAASSAAAVLLLTLAPCLVEGLVTAQYIKIQVNGQDVGWQRMTGPTRLRCRIPAGVIQAGRPIELVFEHPGFLRLDRLGKGADDRPLALRFFALALHDDAEPDDAAKAIDLRPHPPAPSAATDQPLVTSFEAGGPGHACLRNAWHVDDAGHAWTAASVSRLQLPPPAFDGPVSLRIGLAPLVIGNFMTGQRLAVVVAGLMLGQFHVRHETAIAVTLPAGVLAPDEPLDIALCAPDALPMRQFQWADANQALGFELAWISIERAPLRARAALALRGDGLAELPPVALSQKFLDLPADDLRAAIQAELGISPAGLMRATMASFVILPAGEAANDLDWVRVAANAWLLNRDANAAFRAKETG